MQCCEIPQHNNLDVSLKGIYTIYAYFIIYFLLQTCLSTFNILIFCITKFASCSQPQTLCLLPPSVGSFAVFVETLTFSFTINLEYCAIFFQKDLMQKQFYSKYG